MKSLHQDKKLLDSMHQLISAIGEDPNREGLEKTPTRFLKAFEAMTGGYKENIEELVGKALFKSRYEEMVIVRKVEFYSLCEHHMLPFFGHVHVGYIPKGKILGLSKIPRIIDAYAKRLQVQENLTGQIAEALMKILKPAGVGVVIEAHHLCMMMRGVEKQGALTLTTHLLGEFLNPDTRKEFLMQLKGN